MKTKSLQCTALDRFIPWRELIDFENGYEKLSRRRTEAEMQSEINAAAMLDNHRKLEMRRRLDRLIRIDDRLFRISPSSRAPERMYPSMVRLWPCNPRNRRAIRDEMIFDLPEFNCGFHFNPIDWGTNDCLATSVGNKILIGSGFDSMQVNKDTVLEYDRDKATAVHWSPDCRSLALGSETGHLLVWLISKKNMILERKCCSGRNCTITSIQWHPDSKVFAWGCTRGKLSIHSLRNKPITNVQKAHRGYICTLKYSPNGYYLCSSGQDAYLRIWKGKNYNPYMEIEMGNPSRAVAWHPWRTGLLAVGEGPPAPGSLSLWNVNTAKLLFVKKLPKTKAITALDFNKTTGELVFSQCVDESGSGYARRSEIYVLGGPQHVVDSIADLPGSVMALLWSADHTKLGAASTDETFMIWNFHQPVKCKRPHSNSREDLNSLALKRFKGLIR